MRRSWLYLAVRSVRLKEPVLDLAAVRRDRDVRNRRIFRFAGAMRKHGGVFVELRELDGVERFGE